MPIEPDTKDWTWVLERACPACGYDATEVAVERLPELIRGDAGAWGEVLARPDAAVRRDPDRWSDLEYGCHIRDVHRVFAGRVRAMRETEDPLFDNWDQDETAIAGHYDEQDPAVVAGEVLAAAAEAAEQYAAVGLGDWDRPGRRSNGSVFTIASLGRYHLHDLVHHRHDVGAP